jgi:hypothetical protein
MSIDDDSAARNVSSEFEPRKPKHSGRKSIEQRFSMDDDDDDDDDVVAQPAHMATFTKLFHLDDVEQTCPTAILCSTDGTTGIDDGVCTFVDIA